MNDDYFLIDADLFEIDLPDSDEAKLIREKMEFILDFYRLTDDDVWSTLLAKNLRQSFSVFCEFELNLNEIIFEVRRRDYDDNKV
jgi:hypothetical protein